MTTNFQKNLKLYSKKIAKNSQDRWQRDEKFDRWPQNCALIRPKRPSLPPRRIGQPSSHPPSNQSPPFSLFFSVKIFFNFFFSQNVMEFREKKGYFCNFIAFKSIVRTSTGGLHKHPQLLEIYYKCMQIIIFIFLIHVNVLMNEYPYLP